VVAGGWRERGWLACLLAVAAVIHAALTPEHFHERLAYGFFFVAAAAVQASIAVALVRTRELSAIVYRAALWGSLGVVALWIVTRAIAPPLGSVPEEVSLAGVAATAAELAVIVGLVIVGPPQRSRTHRGTRRIAIGWGLVAGLAFALLFALASSTLVYTDTGLPASVPVPSAAMYGRSLGAQSPWVTVVITRHIYINGAMGTLAFLVLAGALLAVAVGLAVPLHRVVGSCRTQRTGWLAVAPAFLVVPSCCAAPVAASLGAGVVAPLLAATPWILAAATVLLLGQAIVLRRRYRRLAAGAA